MKRSTQILGIIFLLGIVYTAFEIFSASDGASAYYDGSAALTISSIILFISSIVIAVIYIRKIKDHLGIIVFLLFGTPLTISGITNLIDNLHSNRDPDLTVRYELPVTREELYRDSIQIVNEIDSIVAHQDESKILGASIDTMIYSQKGDKIFVSYIKTVQSEWGNYYEPGYLVANKYVHNNWHWTDCRYVIDGDYNDPNDLKLDIRKHYFNNFTLVDSLADNYFWSAVL